jgi:hypothetical protein
MGFKRAKPFLNAYDERINAGLEVFPVSLYDVNDVTLINKFTSQYLTEREEAVKEKMCHSVALLPDLRDTQGSDNFEVDSFL